MSRNKFPGRFLTVIVLAVAMIAASGCVNIKKLEVSSFKVNSIIPEGFKAVRASATIGVDNRSNAFKIYDIEGSIRKNSKELGTFVIDPVEIQGKAEMTYTVSGRAGLSDNVSALELLTLIPKSGISEYMVDLRCKVKPKGGAAKKINLKDIPAEALIKMFKESTKQNFTE